MAQTKGTIGKVSGATNINTSLELFNAPLQSALQALATQYAVRLSGTSKVWTTNKASGKEDSLIGFDFKP